MKIELLLAHEDGTWTTEVVDCPDELDRTDLNDVQQWFAEELYGQTQYRKVILFSVYNTKPEEDTDDPRFESEEK